MTDEMHTEASQPATKGDLSVLHVEVGQLKGDVEHLKDDVSLLKDDVGHLKNDVSLLKTDVGLLKDEFRAFRSEFGSFRIEIREMFRPVMITLAHHTAELADIRGYVKDKLVTREEFHSRMDGFAGRVDDSDYSSAKNRVRLDEHEKRISALESRRA